jgi:hypothetical protein
MYQVMQRRTFMGRYACCQGACAQVQCMGTQHFVRCEGVRAPKSLLQAAEESAQRAAMDTEAAEEEDPPLQVRGCPELPKSWHKRTVFFLRACLDQQYSVTLKSAGKQMHYIIIDDPHLVRNSRSSSGGMSVPRAAGAGPRKAGQVPTAAGAACRRSAADADTLQRPSKGAPGALCSTQLLIPIFLRVL